MRGLKRLTALVLMLCVLAAMLSVTAFAEGGQDVVATEKAKAVAALTAPQNPNQSPLYAGSLARSGSTNYTILRNHINNSGVLADDGYVRIIDWLTTDDGSEYYFSAINEPSGIKFQYLSLHTGNVDCGVLLEFVLTSTSVYVSAVADVVYYYNSEVVDEVTQNVSVNISAYTTETLLPFNNSGNYVSSSNFSDIMNSAMSILCQYWDMYCYENLGFGLRGLGFSNFDTMCSHTYDSDCDTTCNQCGETRTTDYSHSYTSDCDAACDNCWAIRTPASLHAFNGNFACTRCYAMFSDVSTTSWQIGHVVYVYDKGLMAGKGSDMSGNVKFDPNSPITREEFVQVLYNAEGKPSVESEKLFPDVAPNGWYKNAVLWAYENNIASGMGNGNFGVGKNISRQDLALMLYKYASLKGYSLSATTGTIYQFADGNSVASYARVAMDWAVTKGVLSGKGTAGMPVNTFRLDPAGTATRAECAAMLRNFMTAFEGTSGSNVMNHAEYMAAEEDTLITIEAYVQGNQEWWEDTITLYAQDEDGGYYIYNAACSEEMAERLIPGTKIRVTGYKAIWMGQHEIIEGQIEILDDGDTYVAQPVDLTNYLGSEQLYNYQGMLASFKGLTIEAIEYKNGEPGNDIYITASLNGNSYEFCVEMYLTGTDSDVYQTVGTLRVGDKVDIEGFAYWYEDIWPHITSIVKK